MKKNKIQDRYYAAILFTLMIILLFAIVAFLLLKQFEQAILNIYSQQQDSYVQLVVDQINLQPDRTDEEIISNIIETLDKSSSHFWTLSKDETLIFVKNVTETNMYVGVPNDEYFISDSALEFLSKMMLYRVQHDMIKMDDVRFVVSGVLFEYNENIYKLCLLTDETVILDNNDFLSTKINMSIYAIALIGLLLVVLLATENILLKEQEKRIALNDRICNQNVQIARLEKELNYVNLYDSRWNVYNPKLLEQFVEKFDKKKIPCMVYARIGFATKREKYVFLEDAQFLLDERVLRFDQSDTELTLVFAGLKATTAQMLLERSGIQHESIKIFEAIEKKDGALLLEQLKQSILEEEHV